MAKTRDAGAGYIRCLGESCMEVVCLPFGDIERRREHRDLLGYLIQCICTEN